MTQYWGWKKEKTRSPQMQQLLARARAIVEEQMWKIEHLKRMDNTSSTLYRQAFELGMPDGLVTGFKEDFRVFKRVYREHIEAAKQLAAMGSAGGFCTS